MIKSDVGEHLFQEYHKDIYDEVIPMIVMSRLAYDFNDYDYPKFDVWTINNDNKHVRARIDFSSSLCITIDNNHGKEDFAISAHKRDGNYFFKTYYNKDEALEICKKLIFENAEYEQARAQY